MLEAQRNEVLADKTIIEKQKKELEEVNNFQKQFFINIAHEIRTPLTLLNGNLNRIKPILQKDDNTADAMEQQIHKIKQIVDDVLSLTKMGNNTFELQCSAIPLSDFVSKLHLAFYSNFANKGIDFSFIDLTMQNIVVNADLIYLERAINNLLINALKYTDAGGKVTLKLEKENNKAVLCISDNGIGMSDEEKSKAFDLFYQANNSINRAGGSGVGLAFAKEIIERHTGNIDVKSELNKGSTFCISLPIYSTDSAVSTQLTTNASDLRLKKQSTKPSISKRLLLVEDHLEMRKYLKQVLSDFEITEANNGQEALKIIDSQTFDYIISDYMMPKMDGKELVIELKSRNIATPILILTARNDAIAKMEMLTLGIDDYLTKPFDESELIARINNGLRNNTERNHVVENTEPQDEPTEDSLFTRKLRAYIESNCMHQHFGISDICEEFAMSSSSLYRKVKLMSGLNTKEFITEVRLNKARCYYEQNNSISAKELANEVGFVNYTHFANLYFERFGKRV